MFDRRSVRLPLQAYAEGLHFVTVRTAGHELLFGEMDDGVVRLSASGEAAREEWLWTPSLRPEVVADAFRVLPDRVHLLFGIVPARVFDSHRAPAPSEAGQALGTMAPATVPAIVDAYKAAVTGAVNAARGVDGETVWQRGYHERVVRSASEADGLRRSLRETPPRRAELRVAA